MIAHFVQRLHARACKGAYARFIAAAREPEAYVRARVAELAREHGKVLTRDELLQRVWGRRATHRDRTVDVFVRKLREKIDRRASRHEFIHTRYGVGYKLEAEPKA